MNNSKTKDFATISEEERNNFKTTVGRFPKEMKYADKLLYLYENLASHLHDYPRNLTPVLQMYWVCFRGFLISTQLVFEAHIPEAYAILSRSAEAVGVARKLSQHPDKVEQWIKKDRKTSQTFIKMLKPLFPQEDKVVYPEVFDIWDLTTEHGRHPNFASTIFFSDFGRMKTENKVDFNYCDFEDEVNLRRCVNYQIYAYLKFLSAFREIFKKHLEKEWVKEFERVESEYGIYKEALRGVFQSG